MANLTKKEIAKAREKYEDSEIPLELARLIKSSYEHITIQSKKFTRVTEDLFTWKVSNYKEHLHMSAVTPGGYTLNSRYMLSSKEEELVIRYLAGEDVFSKPKKKKTKNKTKR